VVATGCRRCRHRCRQLAPGHPVASGTEPRRAGQTIGPINLWVG
jgi:hypothetical protein